MSSRGIGVWLVIRDDGNSQESDEAVDSVWLTKRKAEDRAAEVKQLDCPYIVRVERRKVGRP